jgi:ubiquinol-cytochrome c reductase cytochrome b subunit
MLTGGVFPVEMGLKFDPNVPPGITVPEWYLTGLYAFLRTQYDKFVTGVAWPGLFIFSLLVIPFVDKYKKFSWKDRPLITAVGITSLAQIIVTTYWGFYIDPDRTKSLLERLVIDPIFFYMVMLLLVPLSFGFTYMMIKLAKNAEANAKLQPRKPGGKTAINFPKKWIYIVFVVLLAFQVYLNISAYYAVLNGMKNYSLFIIGIIMLVFAGMFHIYRHGAAMARAPPPKPTTPPTTAKPIPAAPKAVPPPVPKPSTAEPLTTPPVQKAAAAGAQVATKTSRTAATNTTTPPPTGASASSNSTTGDTTNVLAERPSTTEVRKK